MANPYLVQVLYGQRPRSPAAPQTPYASVATPHSPTIANSVATSPSSINMLTSAPTEGRSKVGAPFLSPSHHHSRGTITPSAYLKYEQARYLPPAGPYYDQQSLLDLFPSDYFLKSGKYFRHFKVVQEGSARFPLNTCGVCSTTDHLGKV